MQGSLEEDLAALRKLRDASGALKEYFGDDEDPRQWKSEAATDHKVDGRITTLNLFKCSSLATLPDAIGELEALTALNLFGVLEPRRTDRPRSSQSSIGKLGALTELTVKC